MITCSACGKANQPTRKFCIRCGASLLTKVQEPRQKEPAPEPKVTPAAAPVRKPETANAAVTADKLSVTTEDRWVRPSSVERDRFRTGERHTGKTELEKAREAFAVADKADVETRMLRASEVRQLMAEASAAPQTPAAPAPRIPQMAEPSRPTPPRPARPPEAAPPASVAPKESATAPRSSPNMPPAPRQAISRNGLAEDESEPETMQAPALKPVPEASLRRPAPVAPSAAPPQRPPPFRAQEVAVPRSAYSDDSRVRDVESDIAHFNQQLQQLESELETTRSRLDGDVERFCTAAESRKTRVDNLEDDLRRAKNEWNDADKDYRKAKSRRDKEVGDAEKRIEEQKKRIKNAEAAREKRIREIEKEKQI